ncbi:MAG: hypothetical protein II933_02675 [Candidatus Methanomethylophilaceae archaeon]|nr:hypothetical protein [Candidatus Methanomethylophilaceae archaeon]
MTNRIANENRRDNSAKRIFSYRSVVAMMFRGTVPGFEDTDMEVAESYFGPETVLKGIGEVDPKTGLRYDLIFEAKIPDREKPIRIWINIEPQNDSRMMERLMCRMEYYSANLLVMQKGRTFENDNYYDMADTYSIWVLMDPPKRMRNKIRHIGLSERAVHGDADPPLPFRGIQNIVVIGIGDPEDDGVPVMLKMLDWMMCEGYSRDERRKGLMGLGLTVTKDMEDNILRMNSIDEDRDRRMRDAGREEGRAEERKILMPVLASTVRAFMEDNGLSVEEAVVRARIPEDIRDDIISALSQSSNRNKWTVADMAGYNLRMNSIDEDRDRRMRDEGREEGRALGREEGRALGRAEAKAEMRCVLVSVLTNVARALMEDHGWTVEEALARLNVPDYVRDDVISALG